MEEPSWNMMGDKFQLGPFNDVIVGVTQRVTEGMNFLENFLHEPDVGRGCALVVVGLWIGRCAWWGC